MTFAHPETGELLETKEQFLAAVAEVEQRMVPYWKIRRALREEYAERFEAPLPRARDRSPTQEKVARCPRCGAREEEICPDCGIPRVYCKQVSSNPLHCWRWDLEREEAP